MRNNWKIAFWISIALLLITMAIGFYSIVDQAISLTYLRDSYNKQEQDLLQLQEIINEGSFEKKHILPLLERRGYIDEGNIVGDTVPLNDRTLIFKHKRLAQVIGQLP